PTPETAPGGPFFLPFGRGAPDPSTRRARSPGAGARAPRCGAKPRDTERQSSDQPHRRTRWATLAVMSFEQDDLDRLAAAEEIDVETQAPEGPVHRTTIWVMVSDGDVFLRSVRGESGRWFREASA